MSAMPQEMVLGPVPLPLEVPLPRGGDYNSGLRINTNWPPGTVLTLILGGTPFNAVIAGQVATWHIDDATADLIPAGTSAILQYVNGPDKEVWAIGEVVEYRG